MDTDVLLRLATVADPRHAQARAAVEALRRREVAGVARLEVLGLDPRRVELADHVLRDDGLRLLRAGERERLGADAPLAVGAPLERQVKVADVPRPARHVAGEPRPRDRVGLLPVGVPDLRRDHPPRPHLRHHQRRPGPGLVRLLALRA